MAIQHPDLITEQLSDGGNLAFAKMLWDRREELAVLSSLVRPVTEPSAVEE